MLFCNTDFFLTKQKDNQVYLFSKFKPLNLALVGGVFQHWISFSQCSGLYVLSNNNKFILKVSENHH